MHTIDILMFSHDVPWKFQITVVLPFPPVKAQLSAAQGPRASPESHRPWRFSIEPISAAIGLWFTAAKKKKTAKTCRNPVKAIEI